MESASAGENPRPQLDEKMWKSVASAEECLNINSISIKGYWDWTFHNDMCIICRGNIYDNSESYIVVGQCNHAFHYDCINNWVRTRKNCPLCNQLWVYRKN